jgi:hypothetical protein
VAVKDLLGRPPLSPRRPPRALDGCWRSVGQRTLKEEQGPDSLRGVVQKMQILATTGDWFGHLTNLDSALTKQRNSIPAIEP